MVRVSLEPHSHASADLRSAQDDSPTETPVEHQPWRARTAAGRIAARRPAMGDQALVAALRCEDEGALREFFLRFRPALVLAARRLRVDPGELDALVDDCLADVAVHLITSDTPPPRSLPAYLARSLRNRVLNGLRARARAEQRLAEQCRPDDAGDALEGAVAACCCSDYALRASGAQVEPPALAPALARLANALAATLVEEDRLLAVWLSHCVPPREIAAWLGLGDRAVAKRIERLRERLQLVALRLLEAAEGDERRELLIFLGRASLAPAPAARYRAARAADAAADPSADAEEAPVS
jgi:DNA-directed RNA polymerase specialized sigma24 family protein